LLRFLEDENRCQITIDRFFEESDIELLKKLFVKKYELYEIKILKLYTLSAELIKVLSHYQKEGNLFITSDRSRLVRYLHRLSIDIMFVVENDKFKIQKGDADILLIGGSAQSSKKITYLLRSIDISKYAIVIVQHINAKFASALDKIILNYLNVNVHYAQGGEVLEKNHIYIAPQERHLEIDKEGRLVLEDTPEVNSAKPSISVCFNSLSSFYGERLIAILECGYAADGVDSLKNLQRWGSTVIVQQPSECFEAYSMPKNAIASKNYNYIFTQVEMKEFLNLVASEHSYCEWIEYALEKIYELYEYDYRVYDRNMIRRRVELFMVKNSIGTIKEFVLLIIYNKLAFKLFFLEMSINVSQFFRDPILMRKLVEVLAKFRHNYSIKIWCAGVSRGEEAYSLAILLESVKILEKSLIYATDFNPVVIEEAKNALYGMKDYKRAEDNFKSLELREDLANYFLFHETFVELKESIKKKIMFFVHDLQNSSSFNEFDLIECRNVLIYFNLTLQERVFKLLYDSLKFGGYLCLGSNEFILPSFEEKFEIYDSECKIFKKVR